MNKERWVLSEGAQRGVVLQVTPHPVKQSKEGLFYFPKKASCLHSSDREIKARREK